MAAVIFDFYGTLTPVSPSEAWASNAAQLARVLGVTPAALVRELDDSFPERISGALGDVGQTMATIAGRKEPVCSVSPGCISISTAPLIGYRGGVFRGRVDQRLL